MLFSGAFVNTGSLISFCIVIIFAFGYHELAHAVMADRLGDPTPRRAGRMTWNPFVHLSLIGFIMLFLIGFGGASTPVNPRYFQGNRWKADAKVAIVGPLANVLMAVIFGIFYNLQVFVTDWGQSYLLSEELHYFIKSIFFWGIHINVLLAIFNMLPIPPLDGFTVLLGLMPSNLAEQLYPLRRYGMPILLFVIFALPLLQINFVQDTIGPIVQIATAVITVLDGGWAFIPG